VTFYFEALQAERSEREAYAAILIDLDAVPLNEQVEHHHRVNQAALEISPNPMHDLFEMAHQGQHGEYRFDDHAGVSFASLEDPEVFRIPIYLDKALIAEQHHLVGIALGNLLEGAAIVAVSCFDIPIHNETEMIEHETQLTPDDPMAVGQLFLADLSLAAAFPAGVEQFDAIGIDQTEQGRACHKVLRPMPVSIEQPKQTDAFRQIGEQMQVVSLPPTIKGPIAHPFGGKQNANRDHFAGVEFGLGMFLRFWHLVIPTAQQVDDKMFGGHEHTLLLSGGLLEQCTS
jgi:hypothetical protein